MDDLQKYMKSINPKKSEQAILVYGSEYKLWRDGQPIGFATWTQDDYIGDSFQAQSSEHKNEVEVYIADKWELIPTKKDTEKEERIKSLTCTKCGEVKEQYSALVYSSGDLVCLPCKDENKKRDRGIYDRFHR